MTGDQKRCYIVHHRGGRILAIAPVDVPRSAEGVRLGWRPIAGPDQLVAEVELSAEQAGQSPAELLDGFEVEVGAAGSAPRLRPRVDSA